MVLRLLIVGRLQPGGCGLVCGAYLSYPGFPLGRRGNSRSGMGSLGREVMVKVYGVAMARPQG